jgi:hypothetical protein
MILTPKKPLIEGPPAPTKAVPQRGLGGIKPVSLTLLLVILAFGWFGWPTRYKYDHMPLSGGFIFPVRTDRLTGQTEILFPNGSGWTPMGQTSERPSSES